MDELWKLYEAEKAGAVGVLAPVLLRYTDYVDWQAEMLSRAEGEKLSAYWSRQLAGELPLLNLPTDRPRPLIQTYQGRSHAFKLNERLTKQLKAFSKAEGATLYMVLLAAYQALLHRYTGQQDILVGSPTAGRTRSEFEEMVGYLVNPIVLRADFAGDLSFKEFLGQVRKTVLAALAHQDYPFLQLVEKLQITRDASRSPVFQTMFVLEKPHRLEDTGIASFVLGATGARMKIGGLELESLAIEERIAQFDLSLTMVEADGLLSASLQYNNDLFEASTISRMAGHLEILLEAIATDPTHQISQLPLLTPRRAPSTHNRME